MKFNKYLLFFVFGSVITMQTKNVRAMQRSHDLIEKNIEIFNEQLLIFVRLNYSDFLSYDPDHYSTPILKYKMNQHLSYLPKELLKIVCDYVVPPKKEDSFSILLNSVQQLIKAGANINVQDGLGNTPFIYAAVNHNIPLLQWLINNGADINIKNFKGNTAKDILARKGIHSSDILSKINKMVASKSKS